MPVTFTAGYIEVWRDGALLSRHRVEREAVEAILAAETDGDYEIRTAPVKVNVKRRIFGPDAPALGPVLTISSTELTVTLDRPATGPTRIDRYELERLVGSTWTQIASGLSIFSAANEYPDTGLLPSTLYQYRCRAVDTTERASEYSYAFGTTSAGAANQAPVWQSGTIAVSVQAGSSVSISGYCSDPEGDPLSFSKVSASPGNGSITVSLSGTVQTASDDAGSYTLTARASDGALTADKDIALTVTAVSAGNTWYIEPGVSTYNASQAQPGDTIILRSGTRGPLTITNINGASGNRITVTNESGAVTTIRRASVSATVGGFVWVFQDCRHFNVDGSNGMAAGQYGLKVMYSTNSVRGVGTDSTNDRLASFIKMSNYNIDYTLKRIEVDGGYTPRTHTTHFSTKGSAVNINDISVLRLTGAYAGRWFENIRVTECYFHNCGSIYAGTNWVMGSLPCRNMEIDNNIIHDTWQDGFTCKAWMGGTNSIHDNDVRYTGMDPRADGTFETHEGLTGGNVNQRVGFSVMDGYADVYNNLVRDVGRRTGHAPAAHGFNIASDTLTAAESTIVTSGDDYSLTFPFTCRVYNNVMARCKDRGARVAASSTDAPAYVAYVYCNTVVDNTLNGLLSGGNMTGFVKNNIFAGNGTDAPSGPLTAADNLTNASSSALLTSPSTDDYTLLAAQLAVGTVGDPPTNEIPTTDITGAARANGTADKGAYERS